MSYFYYAALGVCVKVLTILVFFIPLRFFLATREGESWVNFDVSVQYPFATCVLVVFVVLGMKITCSSFRVNIGMTLKKNATSRLNASGVIKHSKTPNSASNAVVSVRELSVVVGIYFITVSAISISLAGFGTFVAIPVCTLIFSLCFQSILSRNLIGIRSFTVCGYFFLVCYIYQGTLSLIGPDSTDRNFLYVLFAFFIFRFYIDAAVRRIESVFKVQEIFRGTGG
jgi:hypothetical protein